MDSQNTKRLAVLIDAENVPATSMDGVFLESEKFGKAVVRRAFGDFNGPQAANWQKVFARHSIEPQDQVSYGRGKNSADIALTIGAMDLLRDGDVDGFCIISSDSDFMPLAIRIRKQGLDCYVLGSKRTPDRVRQACTRFIFLENLRFQPRNAAVHSSMKPLRPLSDAMIIIKTLLTRLAHTRGSWVMLDGLERELDQQVPDFDPRTYGHLRLLDLVNSLGRPVIVDAPRNGDVRVRLRVARKKRARRVTDITQVPPEDIRVDGMSTDLGINDDAS